MSKDPITTEFKHRLAGASVTVLISTSVTNVSYIAEVGEMAFLKPSGAESDKEIVVKIEHKEGVNYSGRVTGFSAGLHGDEHLGYTIGQVVEFAETQIFSFESDRT